MTNEILNMEQLDMVAGGTFTPNKYEKIEYKQAGIKTDYNFFEKDKFKAKRKSNGFYYQITYDQANWAVNYFKTHGQKADYDLIIRSA